MLTRQQIFTKVRDHLLKQGRRSATEVGCLYRHPEGLACAAGCLIPDEHYDPRMEGTSVSYVPHNEKQRLIRDALVNGGVHVKDMKFVAQLQNIHDRSAVENWPTALRNLADDEGLAWE